MSSHLACEFQVSIEAKLIVDEHENDSSFWASCLQGEQHCKYVNLISVIGLPRGQKSRTRDRRKETSGKFKKVVVNWMILKILTFVSNIRVYTTCVRSEKEKGQKGRKWGLCKAQRGRKKSANIFHLRFAKKIWHEHVLWTTMRERKEPEKGKIETLPISKYFWWTESYWSHVMPRNRLRSFDAGSIVSCFFASFGLLTSATDGWSEPSSGWVEKAAMKREK